MVKKENILVICAHSDDQIIGPGATLAKYVQEGKNVYTVICTYGEQANPWLKESIAIKTRIKEAEQANKVIGGKEVIFLGLTEKDFSEGIEKKRFAKKLVTIIKNKRPTKIFTHSPEDPHPMHRQVFHKVLDAVDNVRINPDVFAFDIWNPFIFHSRFPKFYVDVTDTFNIKLKALKCFPSQWASIWSLLFSVYFRAFVHGFHTHKRFAERFFKIK